MTSILAGILRKLLKDKDLCYVRKTGRFFGTIAYYLFFRRRKVAMINCRKAQLGDCKKIVKETFKHTFMSYMEIFYSYKNEPEFLDNHVEIIYKAEEKPDLSSPCFLSTAHLGCWELGGGILTKTLNLKLTAIGRKLKNENSDKMLLDLRKTENVQYIHHRNSAELLNQAIEDNRKIYVLLDHSSMMKDSIIVPFFNIKTTFNKGVPTLAARKKVPIIPFFIIRTETGVRLEIYDAIHPNPELKPRERIFDMALRMNQVYEKIIKQYPEQWYLIHKRFKRTEDENGEITNSFYR